MTEQELTESVDWLNREQSRMSDRVFALSERVRILEDLSHWEQQRDRSAWNAGGWMEPSSPQGPR